MESNKMKGKAIHLKCIDSFLGLKETTKIQVLKLLTTSNFDY